MTSYDKEFFSYPFIVEGVKAEWSKELDNGDILVGYKGSSAYDAGFIYCPYIPLQHIDSKMEFESKEELRAIHGLDAEAELANILAAEIRAELIRELYKTEEAPDYFARERFELGVKQTWELLTCGSMTNVSHPRTAIAAFTGIGPKPQMKLSTL